LARIRESKYLGAFTRALREQRSRHDGPGGHDGGKLQWSHSGQSVHAKGAMSAENPETIRASDTAWQCLQGAYDLQIHVGPHDIGPRIDDIDCAKEFLEHGLKGFVLKSHYVPTGERAQVVTKAVTGIKAFGAITLNHSVGGVNRVAGQLRRRSHGR